MSKRAALAARNSGSGEGSKDRYGYRTRYDWEDCQRNCSTSSGPHGHAPDCQGFVIPHCPAGGDPSCQCAHCDTARAGSPDDFGSDQELYERLNRE